jgi:hypothetical protein
VGPVQAQLLDLVADVSGEHAALVAARLEPRDKVKDVDLRRCKLLWLATLEIQLVTTYYWSATWLGLGLLWLGKVVTMPYDDGYLQPARLRISL